MFDEKTKKAFFEAFHPSLPRLGPGDAKSTRRALEMLLGTEPAGAPRKVLDIGCGNGAATLCLAAELDARITAVDNHEPFLRELERRAAAAGAADRITTRCADMNGLALGGETFDLVWAEGSAFVIGIPQALESWREFVEPGGALGFSDLVWLRDDAPDECHRFFGEEYPAISSVAEIRGLIDEKGWDRVGDFVLPETSWWGPLYDPLARRLDEVESLGELDESAARVHAMCRREIEMFRKYSRYYGYVFFLARKR